MKRITLVFSLLAAIILWAGCAGENTQKNEEAETRTTGESGKLQALSEKISRDSLNADLYNQRAQYHVVEKNVNKALSDINKALELEEDNPEYYITLSDIYMLMGQGIKCEDALEKALKVDPDNLKASLKLGELNFILKDYQDAIKYLNQAIELDNTIATPYLIKGYSYLEGGDTSRAIKNFNVAIDKDPDNHDAFMQLAFIYNSRNIPLAKNYFENAIKVAPASTEAYYGLAMYYQNNLEVDKALETYENLIDIDPNHVRAYYNLGWLNLVYLENFESARDYFSQVIELKSDYADAYYNRGYSNELMGDYAAARKDYKKTMDIHPNYEKAIEALNRLDRKQTIN